MDSNLINSIGLAFDIIGVLLLFKYGLPSEISKTGSVGMTFQQTDHEQIRKWKIYNRWSWAGLGFIITGFALQLVSNFIPN
jgi:hypothetical protein